MRTRSSTLNFVGLGRGSGEREGGAGEEAGEGGRPVHGQSFVGDSASARNFSRA